MRDKKAFPPSRVASCVWSTDAVRVCTRWCVRLVTGDRTEAGGECVLVYVSTCVYERILYSLYLLTGRSQAGKFSKIFARCARRQILIQILENPYLPQHTSRLILLIHVLPVSTVLLTLRSDYRSGTYDVDRSAGISFHFQSDSLSAARRLGGVQGVVQKHKTILNEKY